MNRSLSDLHGRLENIAIQKPLKSLKTTRKGQKNIINAANRARIETTANETKKRRTTKTNEKTESSFSKQFKKTQNRKTNKASTFTISQMKFAKKSKKRRNKTSPPTASSQSWLRKFGKVPILNPSRERKRKVLERESDGWVWKIRKLFKTNFLFQL